MSRRVWYEIWIRSEISDQWEKVARIKSPGLTQIIYEHLKSLYSRGVKIR